MSESILKHSVKTAMVMIAFTIVGTLSLAIIHQTTEAPISKAEAAVRMGLFAQILVPELYDNDLLQDEIKFPAGGDLGNRDETSIYRARLKDKPSAVILEATAPDGYSGDIKLLVAIKADGEIAGVRVLTHKETPGLGDYIDISHSEWIKQFDGQSLVKRNDEAWFVKKDGGQFDFTTGATITPRAVVKTVHKVLKFYSKNQQAIFETAAGQVIAQ
ncbi:MAG: putative oxidoreductase [Pseudomonadota bacterium]|jgi:electron transport complex protein RnfG